MGDMKSELGERACRSISMENEGPETRREWWIKSAALLAESDLSADEREAIEH